MRAACVGFILVACGVAPAEDSPRVITAGKGRVHLAFSPDGKALAISSGDSLKLYGPATGKGVAEID